MAYWGASDWASILHLDRCDVLQLVGGVGTRASVRLRPVVGLVQGYPIRGDCLLEVEDRRPKFFKVSFSLGCSSTQRRNDTELKANKLTGDDCSGDETEQRHRFDGPSKRFGKVDPSGYGELALDLQRLDAAIGAADRDEDEDLKLAEEMLEDWLRRQRELDGE